MLYVIPDTLLKLNAILYVIPDTLLKVSLNTNKIGHQVLRYTWRNVENVSYSIEHGDHF
jgi:hypothetical protein